MKRPRTDPQASDRARCARGALGQGARTKEYWEYFETEQHSQSAPRVRMATGKVLGSVLSVAILCVAPWMAGLAWAGPAEQLRAFVGDRAAKLVAVDRTDSDTMYLLDTEDGELKKLSTAQELACKSPLFSPDGTRLLYNQSGRVILRPLDGDPEVVTAGSEGHWWIDDGGDEWVYYTTNTKEGKLRWPDAKGITTRRRRLKDDKDEHVVDWKAGGGPSQDGTHVGSGYASVIIFDLVGDTHHLLYKQGEEYGQGCNPSMSPDNSYLIMHLDLPHDWFSIRNKADDLMWQIDLPEWTKEWEHPEWSTDGDYATATASQPDGTFDVVVVRLSSSETLKLELGTASSDWTHPHLWIASSNREVPDLGGPIVSGDGGADGGVSDSGSNGDGGSDGCAVAGSGSPSGSAALALLLLAAALSRRQRD